MRIRMCILLFNIANARTKEYKYEIQLMQLYSTCIMSLNMYDIYVDVDVYAIYALH